MAYFLCKKLIGGSSSNFVFRSNNLNLDLFRTIFLDSIPLNKYFCSKFDSGTGVGQIPLFAPQWVCTCLHYPRTVDIAATLEYGGGTKKGSKTFQGPST